MTSSIGMNITDPIAFQAKYQPEAMALCAPGRESVSYARLEKQINNVARHARSLGLVPGQVVAVSISPAILHTILILGLSRAGIATVTVADRKLPPGLRVDGLLNNMNYPYATALRTLPLDFSWTMGDGKPLEGAQANTFGARYICRIHLTSGTTGEPKAVAFTHKMLFERISRHAFLFGNRLPMCSRMFLGVGLGTSFGFRFVLDPVWRGGTVFFYGDGVDHTLRAFDLYHIQSMVAAPSNLAEFLDYCRQYRSFQNHLQVIISAGSHLSKALSERVRARLCTNLLSVYGSTETNTVATAPAEAIAEVPGAVGYAAPDVSVEIVDEAGHRVTDGSEGRIRIRSPYCIGAYMGDAEGSADVFGDGWFYPGDIGSVRSDGLLVVAGRQDAIVNIGGDKVNAEKIDEVLVAFDGVAEAAAFGVVDPLGLESVWAAIVSRSKLDEEALRSHCQAKLPAVFVPRHFVLVDALPRNAAGKIERNRLPQVAKVH